MALVIKTITLGIHKEVNPGKRQAIVDTQALYNQTIAFYLDFFVAHRGVFDARKPYHKKDGTPSERPWTAQELLTFAEQQTLDTLAHPDPLQPLREVLPSARAMPVSLRRAAINHASGKVKAWNALVTRWESQKQPGQCPQLGAPHEPLTFYANLVAYPDFDLLAQQAARHTFIAVTLWHNQRWESVPLPVTLYEKVRPELAASQREQARIREAATSLRAMKGDRKHWEAADKEALRPQTWCAQSFTLYSRPDHRYPGHQRFSLHIPLEKWVDTPQKAEVQRAIDPGMTVVTVDLGVNRLAVIGAFHWGKLAATQFIAGGSLNHHRHRILTTIFHKRQQSGRLQKDVLDNGDLWQKVQNLDENAARQVAVRIVRFAQAHQAPVIVFEYLRRYHQPKEKMSRARRKNHKRAYWLRGKILRWVRDLAFREGILTVERNPAWTSQMCPQCATLGSRQGHHFVCQNPDHAYHADADFVGMMNLYKKWTKTFTYPRKNAGDEPKPLTAHAV